MTTRTYTTFTAGVLIVGVMAGACASQQSDDAERADTPPAAAVATAGVASAPAFPNSPDTATRLAPGDATPATGTGSRARPVRESGPRRVMLGNTDLTGIGYDRGSVTAPVVIIDFSDFGCPYCGQFSRETYPAIEREYVETGKVFFKYVPFVIGMFPHSQEATRATECAGDQGGFWPMMGLVYEAQAEWKRGGDPYLPLSGMAGVAGLDTVRFKACYASKQTDPRTARASKLASDLGVRVTPSFVVNERPIQGALPLADFRKVIDAALMVSRLKK